MLRYLTWVQCVTYMDQDGDLMIKLHSFIFSKGGRGGGGKSTQTSYFCSGTIELQLNTIINSLTHSCEAADVTNGSKCPLSAVITQSPSPQPEQAHTPKRITAGKMHFVPSQLIHTDHRCVSWFIYH